MPGSFLERLVELLSIPQQGSDVLAPNIGVSSPEWLEFNCRVLPASVAGVDTDVSPPDVYGCLCFDSFDAGLSYSLAVFEALETCFPRKAVAIEVNSSL